MNELTGNLLLEEAVAGGSYTEGSSDPEPNEVDIKDCRAARLLVTANTVNSDPLTVTLQEADEEGGEYTDVEDADGNPVQVELTEAGVEKVEAKYTKRFLQVEVTQDTDAEDDFAAIIEAGLAENLPLE